MRRVWPSKTEQSSAGPFFGISQWRPLPIFLQWSGKIEWNLNSCFMVAEVWTRMNHSLFGIWMQKARSCLASFSYPATPLQTRYIFALPMWQPSRNRKFELTCHWRLVFWGAQNIGAWELDLQSAGQPRAAFSLWRDLQACRVPWRTGLPLT